MISDLKHLGLYEDEARVYMALLELGTAYVSAIAKRAGVHRVTCYHTLDNLLKKGLVSVSSGHKTKMYTAENPERLVKKQAEKLQTAEKILPELKALISDQSFKPKIRFVEGKEGIKSILEDTLNTADEILGYSNIELLVELFPKYLHYYTQERQKRHIRSRHLSPFSKLSKAFLSTYYPEDTKREIAEILYIDPGEFPFENEIYIYGNNVATLSLKADDLIGVVTESPVVAQTHRSIFNLSWLGATSFIAQ